MIFSAILQLNPLNVGEKVTLCRLSNIFVDISDYFCLFMMFLSTIYIASCYNIKFPLLSQEIVYGEAWWVLNTRSSNVFASVVKASKYFKCDLPLFCAKHMT